ncbi:3-oxoacyl-[acyl-carrier-protein] synthase, KASII [Marinobacterium lacunae]|uniref:3-oxoacyl-[acyl-carrier-protein] synthase, KASII n=1 Tax=Marinobacterium lacunae TaxID=1232683 RepID=A0A081G0T3_9GAMM|nr:beta-ketoacyl synthase [Marinobacterium lacunae]KEA64388.1 3-oxoacyl-[acyl-carrier-protein] synthase, KASII [Marinobacterium lacunae]MBR9882363.1 beta-ketoacyl synthase [Oceanospirillales bacterium]
MSQLPVIVGFGGISPAGRASFHHGYRRLILDQLDSKSRQETILGLATLMGLASFDDGSYVNADGERVSADGLADALEPAVRDNTLIRRIHPDWFDVHAVTFNRPATIEGSDGQLRFRMRRRQLPAQIPANWSVTESDGGQYEVIVQGPCDLIFHDTKEALVQSAGMLPTGFEPGRLYQSRNHPRGLQMAVYAASDALNSVGIPYEEILNRLSPDQIAVFASNSIGQLDDLGFGGLTKFPGLGKRTTSKQMPLGYAQMPADFINAYLLGNVGVTGGALGACATFLYNLKSGVDAIRSGQCKLAMIGGSDAPVTPEVIEGFRAMGALAEDKQLAALDGIDTLEDDDYRRACRPFGENCGFTIGESSQYLVLMSDELAIELGADIHGCVPDVFVHADGHKKSISAPGVGNYMTLGKSAALVRSMLGEDSLRLRSYVQAHGTSTPQNRVTESHVINEIARAFDIQNWTVSAVKAYLGHSQGTAGGDQIASALGVWRYGFIPGLTTTPSIADDVHTSHLNFSLKHQQVGETGMDSVMINAKGFGGNNATACVLAPHIGEQLLERRHGKAAMQAWREKREAVRERAAIYDQNSIRGLARPTYLYDHQVLAGEDLSINDHQIELPGYANPISLDLTNPYKDMC